MWPGPLPKRGPTGVQGGSFIPSRRRSSRPAELILRDARERLATLLTLGAGRAAMDSMDPSLPPEGTPHPTLPPRQPPRRLAREGPRRPMHRAVDEASDRVVPRERPARLDVDDGSARQRALAARAAPRHAARVTGPRFLYLHGFASGAGSAKGMALAEHYADKGVTLERLDLRKTIDGTPPPLGDDRAHVREVIGGEGEQAVLFGSSLGGLYRGGVAEEDGRVCALVLLCAGVPASGAMAKARIGEAEWEAWRTTGVWRRRTHARGAGRRAWTSASRARMWRASMRAAAGGPTSACPRSSSTARATTWSPLWRDRGAGQGKRHVRLVEVDDGHELVASLDRDRALRPMGTWQFFLGG